MSGLMHKIKETVAPSGEANRETTNRGTGAAEYGSGATGGNTGFSSQPSKASEFGSHGIGNQGAGSQGVGNQGLGSSEFGSTGRTTGATSGIGSQGLGASEFGSTGRAPGCTGAMYGNPTSQQTAGPHSTNMANKVDPRVDSDLDNSKTMGRDQTYGTGAGSGIGAGPGHGTTTRGTQGPHASNAANKLDPRVDSNRDGSTTLGRDQTHGGAGAGLGTTGHGALGGGSHHTQNAGPHSSAAANKLDPRIDSDRDNRGAPGNTGAAGTGVGAGMGAGAGNFGNPASRNTAGPHGSDAMNKLDPRVDSDLDGSKTMGRDQTFSRSSVSSDKNPRDAAQVPPSVLMREVGEPEPLAEPRHGHNNPFGHHGGHQAGSKRP